MFRPLTVLNISQNCLANQSQSVASMGRGNLSLFLGVLSHMTKMATMLIYDQNPSKSLETVSRFLRNLVCKVESSTALYYRSLKLWPLIDLDLFFGK